PLAGGAPWPEQAGQPGALDLDAGMEREQGEQVRSTAGAEARQRLAVQADVERAEETDGQRWGGRIGGSHAIRRPSPRSLMSTIRPLLTLFLPARPVLATLFLPVPPRFRNGVRVKWSRHNVRVSGKE